jgi:hypothetical protein
VKIYASVKTITKINYIDVEMKRKYGANNSCIYFFRKKDDELLYGDISTYTMQR